MKTILIFIFLCLFTFVLTYKSYASVRCETQYGGGETCVRTGELLIDKKVWSTNSNSFVDNLSLSDRVFVNGDTVTFQITVKNTGDKKFDHVRVSDNLPGSLSFISGSLNYDILDLDPGETDTRQFSAKLISDDIQKCILNSATVKDANSDESDTDSSQICSEDKILGVSTLPPTGPSGWIYILIGILALGSIGIYLLLKKDKIWEGVKN